MHIVGHAADFGGDLVDGGDALLGQAAGFPRGAFRQLRGVGDVLHADGDFLHAGGGGAGGVRLRSGGAFHLASGLLQGDRRRGDRLALFAHLHEHIAKAGDKSVEGVRGAADFVAVADRDADGQVAFAGGQLLHGGGQMVQRPGQRAHHAGQHQQNQRQRHRAYQHRGQALPPRVGGDGRGGYADAQRPELAGIGHFHRVKEVGEAAGLVNEVFALLDLAQIGRQRAVLGRGFAQQAGLWIDHVEAAFGQHADIAGFI